MSKTILVVDDEKAVANLLVDIFENNNTKAVKFYNAYDALKYVENTQEDISFCVIDFEMGDMNGLELSKYIYDINANIPIILISGYSEESRTYNVEDVNIKEFVQKPLLIDKIKDLVKKYS